MKVALTRPGYRVARRAWPAVVYHHAVLPEQRAVPIPRSSQIVRSDDQAMLALLELLSRRWAMRVLWELRDGRLGFRVLQRRCDYMSSSVLTQRVNDLRANGLVDVDPNGSWALSRHGDDVIGILSPLSPWAKRWAKRATKRNS